MKSVMTGSMINKGQSVIDWEYAGLAVSHELTGHQQLLAGSASENRDTPGGIRFVYSPALLLEANRLVH
ncbi:hypothetical protein [Klebsiella michiganensis]|uniref:hypothetical protein n=2 Tax=Klebsiella michiganensis TaxID=1134687 RepID=UPI001785A018|nr:hypothetical protein [Klebsiella michiganensis]MBE0189179.1 hypothetical protein [Klebsiella michiganensis]